MKTEADIQRIETQLRAIRERQYGSKDKPKIPYNSNIRMEDREAWKRLSFSEPRDPGWKEAGLEEALAAVLARDREFLYRMISCPSCGVQNTRTNYIETLPAFERAFLSLKKSFRLLNPLSNLPESGRDLGRIAREIGGMVGLGNFRTSMLLICTNCKHYSLDCPFCSTPNRLEGKTQDNQEVSCGSCGNAFFAVLFFE